MLGNKAHAGFKGDGMVQMFSRSTMKDSVRTLAIVAAILFALAPVRADELGDAVRAATAKADPSIVRFESLEANRSLMERKSRHS